MNAFQAIEDAPPSPDHKITIKVERERGLFDDGRPAPIHSFTVIDTGVGFDDANFASFNELFSEWKLPRGGKGIGRMLWLKAFHKVEVDSSYAGPDKALLCRRFTFDKDYDPERVGLPTAGSARGATVHLAGYQEPYKSQGAWTLEQLAHRLIEHFLLVFLDPTCPRVILEEQGLPTPLDVNATFVQEFKESATTHPFEIKGRTFLLNGFRLHTQQSSRHRLIYAANRRGVVQDNLSKIMPNLSGAKLPGASGETFYYLAIVQSDYLSSKVNPARTDFDLAQDDGENDGLFPDEITRAEIRDACVEHIQRDLSDIIQSINEAKIEAVKKYTEEAAPQYRILVKYLDEFIDTIPPEPTRSQIDAALHRQIHEREVRLRQESTRIIREADKVADYDDYARRLHEVMSKYGEVGMSQLATYVSHRKVILELMERAISKAPHDNKYPLENVVHQLVFPLRSTSAEIPYQNHNLWLVDERLTFHSLIASDKPLSSIQHFEVDSEKRPDLFIFDRKVVYSDDESPLKSIVLVEFKRPQRNDYTMADNPVTQCLELVSDIRNSKFKMENGRPVALAGKQIPAYCFIVADVTSTLERVLKTFGATEVPGGEGWFMPHPEAYIELMTYDKLLGDAKKRNRVFFDKLSILAER